MIINTLLLGLFAIQHSVMARPAFKRWWTRLVPQPVERTTYVLLASLALVLLYWQWRPIPQPVWSVSNPAGVMVLQAIFWIGWALVLISTFLINHFELFGLRQVYARLRGRTLPAAGVQDAVLLQTGPPSDLSRLPARLLGDAVMTAGHLLFAIATSGYILIGIWLEERDLIAVVRRSVSSLSRAGVDADPAARAQGIAERRRGVADAARAQSERR